MSIARWRFTCKDKDVRVYCLGGILNETEAKHAIFGGSPPALAYSSCSTRTHYIDRPYMIYLEATAMMAETADSLRQSNLVILEGGIARNAVGVRSLIIMTAIFSAEEIFS